MPASMHPASKGMSAFRPALLSAVLALAAHKAFPRLLRR